jgi:hypothetical protein
MVVNISNAIEKIKRYENSLRSAGEEHAADTANDIIARLSEDEADIKDIIKRLIASRDKMKERHFSEALVTHYAISWLLEEAVDDHNRLRHEQKDEITSDD